jgi:hypothetical protein
MISIPRIIRMLPAAMLCVAFAQARPLEEGAAGGTVTLREGTPALIGFAENISSKTAAKGDAVAFVLVNDINVGGLTVAKAGCKVIGQVAAVKKATAPGKSGALDVQLDYLAIGNAKVRLRGSKDNADRNGIQYSLPYHLKWPMGLLRTGDDIEIKQGTTLTVFVAQDISLPAAQ